MTRITVKTDVNTLWIKAIRYTGTLFLGAFLGIIFYKLKNDLPVEWINFLGGSLSSLFLSVFPGFGSKHHVTVNDSGIFTSSSNQPETGYKSEYPWEKIRSAELDRNRLLITTTAGNTERVRLPIFTKTLWSELEAVLDHYNRKIRSD